MKVFWWAFGWLLLSVTVASGQGTGLYITAYNYYSQGEYLKAKESIDKALTYEDAQGKAKAWMIKGDVYSSLVYSQVIQSSDLSKSEVAIAAIEAYSRASELDTRRIDEKQLLASLNRVANATFGLGVNNYNDRNYATSLECFKATLAGKNIIGDVDTLALYNTALCYENLNQHSSAIAAYRKCIDLGYQSLNCYSSGIYQCRLMGNDAAAMDFVNEGLSIHPNSYELLASKVNLLLAAGRSSEALPHINQMLGMEPGSAVLHYSRGTIYSGMGQTEKAIVDFKKACELRPGYFDATYNLGAEHFNQGADAVNEAALLSDETAHEAKQTEAADYFKEAQVYLEKALELDSSTMTVMQSLSEVYLRLDKMEEYKGIKARIEEL